MGCTREFTFALAVACVYRQGRYVNHVKVDAQRECFGLGWETDRVIARLVAKHYVDDCCVLIEGARFTCQ